MRVLILCGALLLLASGCATTDDGTRTLFGMDLPSWFQQAQAAGEAADDLGIPYVGPILKLLGGIGLVLVGKKGLDVGLKKMKDSGPGNIV